MHCYQIYKNVRNSQIQFKSVRTIVGLAGFMDLLFLANFEAVILYTVMARFYEQNWELCKSNRIVIPWICEVALNSV